MGLLFLLGMEFFGVEKQSVFKNGRSLRSRLVDVESTGVGLKRGNLCPGCVHQRGCP